MVSQSRGPFCLAPEQEQQDPVPTRSGKVRMERMLIHLFWEQVVVYPLAKPAAPGQ